MVLIFDNNQVGNLTISHYAGSYEHVEILVIQQLKMLWETWGYFSPNNTQDL